MLIPDNNEIKTELTRLKYFLLGLSQIKGIGWKTIRDIYALKKKYNVRLANLNTFLKKKSNLFNSRVLNILLSRNIEEIENLGERKHKELISKNVEFLLEHEFGRLFSNLGNQKPYWIFVQGNKNLLFNKNKLFIGIVGTREPSKQAIETVKILVEILKPYPVIVVSGLAKGIDYHVHKESIKLGIPNVSILGYGLDTDFSKESRLMKHQILENEGVIVSEYFPTESYGKEKFLRRNKLIASISDILIPVEAKVPSGTYSTVIHAKNLNKLILGFKLENNPIENYLRKEKYEIFDFSSKEEIKRFDHFLQMLLISRKIEYDPLKKLKENISKLIKNELRFRWEDRELYSELSEFFGKLANYFKEREEKNVD